MMETIYFDLVFLPNVGMAMPSVAIVQVKASGSQTYAGENYDGLISPECSSVTELDTQIDFLQRELEQVRKLGHKQLAKAA
jgi:hypothetical protein